jgi:hypothetical protein
MQKLNSGYEVAQLETAKLLIVSMHMGRKHDQAIQSEENWL